MCAFYNSRNWCFAAVTADDAGEPHFQVTTSDNGVRSAAYTAALETGPAVKMRIRVRIEGAVLRFSYRPDQSKTWIEVDHEFDARNLSDEHANRVNWDSDDVWAFTGSFFGLWVQDFTGSRRSADFDWAEYRADLSADAEAHAVAE